MNIAQLYELDDKNSCKSINSSFNELDARWVGLLAVLIFIFFVLFSYLKSDNML